MNYRLIIICFILMLCCGGCGKTDEATDSTNIDYANNNKDSVELIEQIFNINDSKYEIIEEKNRLSNEEYGGSYIVTLKIGKNDKQQFINELEKSYSTSTYFEDSLNEKNYYGEELGENDRFYYVMTSVKRIIEDAEFIPKSCSTSIICTEATDGTYIVEMEYLE